MEGELSLMEEKGKEVTQEQKELLYNQVKELKCSNAALLAEIDMLERFIGRLDPQDLVSQAGGDDSGAAGDSQLEGGGRGPRRRSQSNISDRLQQLTLEQKLYVAQREVAETRQDQEKLKQRHDQIQDNYKASMEEADLRLAEIRKAKIDFERRMVKPMKDKRFEMMEPNKVLRYIEDKSKVTQVEKLTRKNHALKVHEKKLQQQLQQKKETGKAEYEVDDENTRRQVAAALPTPATGPLHHLQPGDFVLVKDFRRKSWKSNRWKGPYQMLLVTQTAVKNAERPTWVHASHCKVVVTGQERR
ncbi:coiled-coil domain-containing protein 113-like [Notothenia coriiceps]|uniref:Coiled-coil domain-containing protein 113-like n=1 Tax=Notothenia coriiceps TaxID=8208 RepID=A0A6I9NLT5_9TELE|nr:PREDICTED: coiled-coil domain-containing protein 113-like [Notothenia coriiceps]